MKQSKATKILFMLGLKLQRPIFAPYIRPCKRRRHVRNGVVCQTHMVAKPESESDVFELETIYICICICSIYGLTGWVPVALNRLGARGRYDC